MDTIADFYSKEDEIKSLVSRITSYRLKVQVQRTQKDKAIISRDKEKKKRIRTCDVLLKLKADGLLRITDKEIAKRCFISEQSVRQAKCLMVKVK